MPSSSPSNFQLIVDAFDDYTKQVGIDLTKNALADALRACDSPNAVFEPLQAKAHAFKDYRDGERKLSSWPSQWCRSSMDFQVFSESPSVLWVEYVRFSPLPYPLFYYH